MNLSQFLHFNDECPVCTKPLSLYMYVSESSLWKATQVSPGMYKFTHTMLTKKVQYAADDYMMLYDLGAAHDTRFNSTKLDKDSKTWQLFFFKLCNTEALIDNEFDYDMSWYDACYHRSSPLYEFKHHPSDPKKWRMELAVPEQAALFNRDESFAFKKIVGDLEKVYLLSLDSENKKTKFHYYSTTSDERRQVDFEPKYFDKDDMPLMRVRPDLSLSNRDKLLERFDTWIIFS
jgi:hypothetical protein